MALLWLLLGVSAAIGLLVSYYWIKYGVPILALLTSMVGVSVFLFSVAWVIKSMYNGEPLAASSGLITFGLLGILLIVIGWSLIKPNIDKQSN